MKKYARYLVVLGVTLAAHGVCAEEVVELWQGQPPHFKSSTLEEYVEEAWGVPCAHNVTKPTLTIYPARGENSGTAIVVLPGGGYVLESIVAEGSQIAEHLAAHGITAAVLKYRLPLVESSDRPQLVPEADARRAIRLLRSRAGRYGFEPSKVGVMGFSAGGHLAATVSVLPSESADENPDFSALVYTPVTMSAENREWLEETLFHRAMTEDELRRYAPVENVDAATPPAFLVHAYDDELVPITESEAFAAALTAAGREVELHFFARGGHGFGPGRAEDGTGQWLQLVADWIRRQ
jgi:acetyl esterase/lipase